MVVLPCEVTLESIYRNPDLRRFLLRLTRDPALTEDLLHQAIERFLKERARKQIPDEKIRPVLFRLSYQAFIEWRRKEMSEERKRQALIQLRPPADEEEALVEAVFEEALAVGSSLSPQQKEILVLRVRCAMSVDDVCVALSISNSTYHRSMRRAEEKLKELFAQVRSSSDVRRRPPLGGPT